ncbi:hypothetical protein RB195_012508 [Necator americanus]|uniref:Uncharacterized protein n=1 Tax=Necator americanus TaxID=51031 RepID=A0ABR1D7G7_NECAM
MTSPTELPRLVSIDNYVHKMLSNSSLHQRVTAQWETYGPVVILKLRNGSSANHIDSIRLHNSSSDSRCRRCRSHSVGDFVTITSDKRISHLQNG